MSDKHRMCFLTQDIWQNSSVKQLYCKSFDRLLVAKSTKQQVWFCVGRCLSCTGGGLEEICVSFQRENQSVWLPYGILSGQHDKCISCYKIIFLGSFAMTASLCDLCWENMNDFIIIFTNKYSEFTSDTMQKRYFLWGNCQIYLRMSHQELQKAHFLYFCTLLYTFLFNI